MMSTSRLRILHSQETKHRKFVCVMNDVVKTQKDLLEGYIDKEKTEAVQKLQKSIVHTRKDIVRQRVLKQCMKNRREAVEKENAKTMYGRYLGVPVETIEHDIDAYLEEHHPRIRRKQKVEQLFHDGFESGAILDKKTISEKVTEYFKRPLVEVRRVPKEEWTKKMERDESEENESFLPAISSGFYTGLVSSKSPSKRKKELFTYNLVEAVNRSKEAKIQRPHKQMLSLPNTDTDPEKFFTKRKKKHIREENADTISVHSMAPTESSSKRGKDVFEDLQKRPATLPPIKVVPTLQVTDEKGKLIESVSKLSEIKESKKQTNSHNKKKPKSGRKVPNPSLSVNMEKVVEPHGISKLLNEMEKRPQIKTDGEKRPRAVESEKHPRKLKPLKIEKQGKDSQRDKIERRDSLKVPEIDSSSEFDTRKPMYSLPPLKTNGAETQTTF